MDMHRMECKLVRPQGDQREVCSSSLKLIKVDDKHFASLRKRENIFFKKTQN